MPHSLREAVEPKGAEKGLSDGCLPRYLRFLVHARQSWTLRGSYGSFELRIQQEYARYFSGFIEGLQGVMTTAWNTRYVPRTDEFRAVLGGRRKGD